MDADKSLTANFSPVLVSSISIPEGDQSKQVGDADFTLTVNVSPSDALDKSVTWDSDNESVATVTSAGVVSVIAAGTANITATANDGSGVSGSVEVTVTDPIPSPSDTIQAEDYINMSGVSVQEGYGSNGEGNGWYVDYGDDGTYAEWVYNAGSSGTVTLELRYANGSYTRPLAITVNGVSQGSFECVNTGGWENWIYISQDIPVSGGNDTIRLTAYPSAGPNIDELVFSDVKSAKGYEKSATGYENMMTNVAKVNLYPNPVNSSNMLNIELTGFENEANATVYIMDISGRTAYSSNVTTKDNPVISHELNTGALSSGVYMVTVRSENKVINKRLVIK